MAENKFVATLITLVLLSAMLISITGCSNNSFNNSINSIFPSTSGRQYSATGNLLKFQMVSIIDQQGTGKEAFKLLVPSDWNYDGRITWVLDNPYRPAVSQLRVWNPKGTEEFDIFPSLAYFWTDDKGLLTLFPIGSKYFGSEVKPILSPLDALRQVVIPKYRPNAQYIKIIDEKDISNTLPAGSSSTFSSLKAGKIRSEYTQSGILYEDELYCTIRADYFPTQGILGVTHTHINWNVNNISSFRAEKGKLDSNAKIFQTVARSIKMNLKWYNTYVQVVESLIKMQINKMNSMVEMGAIISHTGDDIRQEIADSYYKQESVYEGLADQFDEVIMGTDPYLDPSTGEKIELPYADNAWMNNLGEIVLSDNPNFNPNYYSNQNFQQLQMIKR